MSDPYWDNVSLLMHMDGANGSTTFVDETGKTVTRAGNAVISTVQSKFGGASGYFDGAGDWLQTVNNLDDFRFGTGNFTVELFLRTSVGSKALIDFYGTGVTGSWQLYVEANGRLAWYANDGGSAVLVALSSGDIRSNTWRHIAVCRSENTLRLFIDGYQEAIEADARDYSATAITQLAIGAQVYSRNAAYDFNGYIDELRITKGIARYTSSFTPPTAPFYDPNTPQLIDVILSGQLTPSPLSQLLVTNWPVIGAETSGTLSPSGFITINNPQIIESLLYGTLSPSGFISVNNPQIITSALSGTMSPTGSVMVSSYWLIEAVASGRLSPSQAAHILVDNLDPGQVSFAQIVGEITLYSEMIRSARVTGTLDLSGGVTLSVEHEAQVAGTMRLINGEASLCGCPNG